MEKSEKGIYAEYKNLVVLLWSENRVIKRGYSRKDGLIEMYLETERLIIRNIELSDEQALIHMASDGSLDEDIFGGWSGEYHEWMHGFVQETKLLDEADDPKKEYLAYTLVEKETGVPVGSVGCSYYEDMGTVGLVYFIGTEHRRKGYATEAAKAYVKYFGEHYEGLILTANVRVRNIASCKVIEKIGFTLMESKMYKDFLDEKEELYNFYEIGGYAKKEMCKYQ